MTRLVIEGCAIVTVDGDRTEHADGHIVVRPEVVVRVDDLEVGVDHVAHRAAA